MHRGKQRNKEVLGPGKLLRENFKQQSKHGKGAAAWGRSIPGTNGRPRGSAGPAQAGGAGPAASASRTPQGAAPCPALRPPPVHALGERGPLRRVPVPRPRARAVGPMTSTVVSPGVARAPNSQGGRLGQVVPAPPAKAPPTVHLPLGPPAPPQPPGPQPGRDRATLCAGAGVAGTDREGAGRLAPRTLRWLRGCGPIGGP